MLRRKLSHLDRNDMDKEKNEMPYIVKSVQPEADYILLVRFADGTKKRYDMKPIIARGGIFEKIKDPSEFSKVHVARDTVVWDDVLDIAPESLYEKGITAR